MVSETTSGQKCRTCGALLTTEYLRKLSESPGRWHPCPGHICPEYCRELGGKIEQQNATVLRRQLII